MTFGGLESGGPPNGTQAHDLSRELRFGRPAQVGATPFGEPPLSKPLPWETFESSPLRGTEKKNNKQLTPKHKSVTHVLSYECYRCPDPARWAELDFRL